MTAIILAIRFLFRVHRNSILVPLYLDPKHRDIRQVASSNQFVNGLLEGSQVPRFQMIVSALVYKCLNFSLFPYDLEHNLGKVSFYRRSRLDNLCFIEPISIYYQLSVREDFNTPPFCLKHFQYYCLENAAETGQTDS